MIDNLAMCDLCFCSFDKDRIKSYQIQHVLYRVSEVANLTQFLFYTALSGCQGVSLPVAFAQDGGYRGVRLRAISSEDIENGTRKFHRNIVLPGKPWGNRETNDFFLKLEFSNYTRRYDTIMTYYHTVLQNLLLWHLTLLSCLCCLSAVVLAVTA